MTSSLGRLHYLDNLKIFLTSFVVLHHGAQAYVSTDNGWVIKDSSISQTSDKILGILLSTDNSFLMALFFLISAFFIADSIKKKGITKYLNDRALKLLGPIVIFMFIIFPLLGILLEPNQMSPLDFLTNKYFNLHNGIITMGHTWFLANLFLFTFIYCIWHQYFDKGKYKSISPSFRNIILTIIILTLVTFLVRIKISTGYWTSLHLFEPARIPSYLIMFAIGVMANKNNWFEKMNNSAMIIWLSVSIILISSAQFIITNILKNIDMWAMGANFPSFALSAWDSIVCLSLSIFLILFFKKYFNKQNKLSREMASNSFAVYLIHPFVLIPVQSIMLNISTFPLIKFILVAIFGISLSYLVVYAFKRVRNILLKTFSFSNKILNQ
jgi:fucose 4-O-acetylase-like acetyltransferase